MGFGLYRPAKEDSIQTVTIMMLFSDPTSRLIDHYELTRGQNNPKTYATAVVVR